MPIAAWSPVEQLAVGLVFLAVIVALVWFAWGLK